MSPLICGTHSTAHHHLAVAVRWGGTRMGLGVQSRASIGGVAAYPFALASFPLSISAMMKEVMHPQHAGFKLYLNSVLKKLASSNYLNDLLQIAG